MVIYPPRSYSLRFDFDLSAPTVEGDYPLSWLRDLGLIPDDFGILVQFENGCQVHRPAIPRPTPTAQSR